MIRLLLNVVNFAWNSLSEREETHKNVASIEKETKKDEIVQIERISSFGRITSVHDGYGIIDGYIYFDFSTVLSGRVPSEGLRVLMTAVSQGSGQGFVAESVQIMSECWEEENDGDMQEEESEGYVLDHPRIGRIVDMKDDRLYVNDDIVLNLNDLKFKGFSPYVGDWITLNSYRDEKDSVEITIEVVPLRVKSFSGQVTSLKEDLGYFEDEVFFRRSDCDGDYRAAVGDLVRGIMVENSLTDKYKWRLIKIRPLFTAENLELKQREKIQVQNLTELVQDKNGVTVTSPLDFDVVMVGQRKCITAFIRNGSSEDRVLEKCVFCDNAGSQFYVIGALLKNEDVDVEAIESSTTSNRRDTLIIGPGMTAYVNIICNAKFLGKAREMLVFKFDNFSIGRNVFSHVKDPKYELVAPTSRLSNNRNNRSARMFTVSDNEFNIDGSVMPGERLKTTKAKLPVFLQKYLIPKDLMRYSFDRVTLLQHLPFLEEELSMENYKEKLAHLLHLEEIRCTEEMKQFDMERVFMKEIGEYLTLEVPGLSEGRPSVLVGDSVIATDPDGDYKLRYEGCVHEVKANQLFLKFHEQFHNSFSGKDYNIAFKFNRCSLRRCHQAISLYRQIGRDVLFPKKGDAPKVSGFKFDPSFVCNTRLNDRQLQAVRCIVEGRGRPAPYIIYGPPGTGKTVTLVEAVLQVYLQQSWSRILICAPSNSAADLVCERLHYSQKVRTSDMVRLNAHHRKEEFLPEPVSRYSDGCLELKVLLHYRIIISTCVTSGLLYGLGVKPGHFTHVFIDEAGQATEPEAMIALCLAAVTGSNTDEGEPFQIILAGDPKQLGPVLRSHLASQYGLELSLLERYSLRSLYCRDNSWSEGYNPVYVTKLVNNYRSHSDLLSLPSELFYDGELVPKANPVTANSLCGWKHLPNSIFPILFHGIRGDDLQELDSPSWFNAEEVFRVVCYLQSLYCDLDLKGSDVGIVTPYRKQVEKIRLLIETVGVEAPKIGSVEEFQGQERSAIIVSTVRSTESWVSFDESHNLGFIFNTKRFNVTITRAKSLLVVVGNPFVLLKDTTWRKFLRYCLKNNAYVGCDEIQVRELLFGHTQ